MPETDHYPPMRAPEAVAAAAAERGLGDLISTRVGPTVSQAAGTAGAVAACCLVLLIPCWAVLQHVSVLSPEFPVVDAIYRGLFIALLISVVWAIRAAVTGQQSWYLYARGVVQQKRRRRQVAVAWPEALGLGPVYRRRGNRSVGEVIGYRLAACDGTSLFVPLKTRQGGRDPFIDQVLAVARENNCPIA